jgi:hypothetical protein
MLSQLELTHFARTVLTPFATDDAGLEIGALLTVFGPERSKSDRSVKDHEIAPAITALLARYYG